jgi:hypothetical protein
MSFGTSRLVGLEGANDRWLKLRILLDFYEPNHQRPESDREKVVKRGLSATILRKSSKRKFRQRPG